MEFGIEKWDMPITKSRKRNMTDGMELPNKENIRIHEEKKTYNIKADMIENNIKRISQENETKTRY